MEDYHRADKGGTHKYPKNRKRTLRGKIQKPYTTRLRRKMTDAMVRLIGYCPQHSFIYTITYMTSDKSRYQYVDVFCINNNQIFKISKLVAYIMKTRIVKNNRKILNALDVMVMRTHQENIRLTSAQIVTNETEFIKLLSKKLFNHENGFNHQPMILMKSVFDKKVDSIPEAIKKSYIAKTV